MGVVRTRKRHVRLDYVNGMKTPELATKYGVSEKTIIRYIRRFRNIPKQNTISQAQVTTEKQNFILPPPKYQPHTWKYSIYCYMRRIFERDPQKINRDNTFIRNLIYRYCDSIKFVPIYVSHEELSCILNEMIEDLRKERMAVTGLVAVHAN